MTDNRARQHFKRAAALDRAIDAWVLKGDASVLERWLDSELESDGAPIRLSIPEWTDCLGKLVEARRRRAGWKKKLDQRVIAFVRSLLRFSRADGTSTTQFGSVEHASRARVNLRSFARAYPRTGESRVIDWWLSLPDPPHVPPPLPAWSSQRHVLAVLRAGWQKKDDVAILDQRNGDPSTAFELIGSGISWLGSDWRLAGSTASAARARPGCWVSNSVVDLAEWSYRVSGLQLTRSMVLLRGLRLAILGEQVDGRALSQAPLVTRVALPPGVKAESITGSRGLLLRSSGSRSTAQVLPVALPALPYETDRGHFRVHDDGLELSVSPKGRRCWLPIVVSWDAQRNRKRLSWRILTVSEDSRVCPADVAFAVRVSWGREDTLVVYRSLGAPAPRAFLGHQTKALFHVGKFTREGAVEPLLSVD